MPNKMTPKAINSDKSLGLPLYDVKKIYIDPEFNHRGAIYTPDVVELALDLARNGLLEPIIIRKRDETTPPEYDYVVVAGHRRLTAYLHNDADEIPAILRVYTDQLDARADCIRENVHRADLNLMMKANAIKPFVEAGWIRRNIAEELTLTEGTVQILTYALNLPEPIQELLAKGELLQADIRPLYKHRNDPDAMFDMARQIKTKRKLGQKVDNIKPTNRKDVKKAATIRKRSPGEIDEMIKLLGLTIGYGLTTRMLAWANGNVKDGEVYEDLRVACEAKGADVRLIPEVV